MTQIKTQPLYKMLNEEKNLLTRLNGEFTVVNHWRNGISIVCNEEKVLEMYSIEAEDDYLAKYIALALNNFEIVADALKVFIDKYEALPKMSPLSSIKFDDNDFVKAKEALSKIS